MRRSRSSGPGPAAGARQPRGASLPGLACFFLAALFLGGAPRAPAGAAPLATPPGPEPTAVPSATAPASPARPADWPSPTPGTPYATPLARAAQLYGRATAAAGADRQAAFAQAVVSLETALSQGAPGTPLLLYRLGACYHESATPGAADLESLRRYAAALTLLAQALFLVERDDEEPAWRNFVYLRGATHARLGQIYLEGFGRSAEAESHFREALSLGEAGAREALDRLALIPASSLQERPLILNPWLAADVFIYGRSEAGPRFFAQEADPLGVRVAERLLWSIVRRPRAAGPLLSREPVLMEARRWDLALAVAARGGLDQLYRLEARIRELALASAPTIDRLGELRGRIIARLGELDEPGATRLLAWYLISEDAPPREAALRVLAPKLEHSRARLVRLILSTSAEMLEQSRALPLAAREAVCARVHFGLVSLDRFARVAPAAPTASPTPGGANATQTLAPAGGEVLELSDLSLLAAIAVSLEPDVDRSLSCRTLYTRAREMLWERIGESRAPEAFHALFYLARPFRMSSAPPPAPAASGAPLPLALQAPLPTGLASLSLPTTRPGQATPVLVPVPTPPPGATVPAPFVDEARQTLRLRSPSAWGVELSAGEAELLRAIRLGRPAAVATPAPAASAPPG